MVKIFMSTHPKSTMSGYTAEEMVHRWIFEGPINSAKGQCLNNFINEKDDNE